MDHVLAAPHLLDEFLDAGLVEESLLLVLLALIGERDLNAGIQEGQLAQAIGQEIEFELGGDRENLGIGLEGDERARVLGFADDLKLARRAALLELHEIDLQVARYLDLEPGRKRVDALGTHAV